MPVTCCLRNTDFSAMAHNHSCDDMVQALISMQCKLQHGRVEAPCLLVCVLATRSKPGTYGLPNKYLLNK